MKNMKLGLNRFTFLLVFIYFLVGIGVTYAYFAFSYENSTVITGNVVAVDADLTVERVVGTDKRLVPMTDDALGKALLGSENGACIDSLGNLSCQVYKITLTNNASRLQHLVGTIELYPKVGTDSAYSNLRWQELSSTTQVKDEAIVNGMSESILVSGLTMESKESKTWYVGVWLSETDEDQKDIDKGEFQGTVTFEVNESIVEGTTGELYPTNVFVRDYMAVNSIDDASLDFSKTSEESGTNGIYVRNNTINDTYPIYYYRGNVNNNLIFADFCWKIVRTTETGGLKLIYNGIPSNGTCNNMNEASIIGTKNFNSNNNSPTYVGYMYGDVYQITNKYFSDDTTEYVFSNSVSYENGTYTLTGGTTSGQWSNMWMNMTNNYHYTCFSTSTVCDNTGGKVYYIYYTKSSTANYITLNGEASIEVALSNMLDKNTTSSAIKGSDTETGSIDYWFYNNLSGTDYESYIEDTVWCNDRSIHSLGGFNPNGGSGFLDFGAYNRAYSIYKPDLTCARDIDKFTVAEANGNGDLTYPVGLLTADEVMLAGAKYYTSNSSYYLYIGGSRNYWAGSPFYVRENKAEWFNVSTSGDLFYNSVNSNLGVRPSISLKSGFKIVDGGEGTVEKPYVVE